MTQFKLRQVTASTFAEYSLTLFHRQEEAWWAQEEDWTWRHHGSFAIPRSKTYQVWSQSDHLGKLLSCFILNHRKLMMILMVMWAKKNSKLCTRGASLMKLASNLANYSTLCSSSCTIRPSRDVLPSKKLSRFFTCATVENVWTMKLKPSLGKYNQHLSRMRKLGCFIFFLSFKMTRVFQRLVYWLRL